MGTGASVPVHPLPVNDVLGDLDAALRTDQTIEGNRKKTVSVLRRLPKLKNVTDRDLLDTCILLQEAKEKKAMSSPQRLTQADIDQQIRIYNTERMWVVIDHGLRGLYKGDSWLKELKSRKLKNVEVDSNGLNFVEAYMVELRKRRTEKENKVLQGDTRDLTNIFCRRLNMEEIQDSIDTVNRYQSVVRVMWSKTSKELMASVKIKYVDLTEGVKGKKEQTFVSYHKLLRQSKETGSQKDLYMRVAKGDNVTGEDIEECLREIRRITAHHDAIVKINQVIARRSTGLMSALQDSHTELELPSHSNQMADREREYEILLYGAYTDKADNGTDVRMNKDDIQKVLLILDILKEIYILKKEKLMENLKKDEMDISEYIVDNMDECYSTLIAERKEKKDTSGKNSCQFLTRQEIEDIVKEFKAVWDIQQEGLRKEEWIRVLRDAKMPEDKPKEAEFEKLQGYRKLFEDEIKNKKRDPPRPGFENLLERTEVERIMFSCSVPSNHQDKQDFICAKKEQKEHKDIVKLEKRCLKELERKEAKLLKGIVVNNKHKGYLTLLSEKRGGDIQQEGSEDKCFVKRLTWEQMDDVLSDWQDFERFVEKIVSRRVTDTECLDIFQNFKKELKDTMQYYRYRRKEEQGRKGNTDKYEGEDFEELWGHTVLHLAVCANKTETATAILNGNEGLIHTDNGTWTDDKDAYKGLTPFLIAVAQGNILLVKRMLETDHHGTSRGIGKRMNGTVFMGQLPFHTAVLCYINDPNKNDTYREPENRFVKIIQLLAKEEDVVGKKDVLKERNYRGDTVLHSIMRFVNCFPACEQRAVDMMSYLESLMEEKANVDKEDVINYKRKLFLTQNNNQMTALQLATESGHIKLFAYLFKVKGVYLIEHPHDELYEIRRFDVTEIDKIALTEAHKPPSGMDKTGTNHKKGSPNEAPSTAFTSANSSDAEPAKVTDQPEVDNGSFGNNSVAELLCCQRLPVATELVRGDVFEEMVRRKMNVYWVPLLLLSVFHISLLLLLSVYVVARAAVTEGIYWPSGFLEFCNIYTFVCSCLYFVQEFPLRCSFAKQPFAWTAVHHNVVYRVTFVLFGIFLFADSIFYRIPNSVFVDYKTTFLVLAIIVGTWSTLFFLRIFRRFSVYIVLLNEALFTAVVPFAVLILMQVFMFSACMHASFLHNEANTTVVDDFSQYGMSLLTMGKLMVGLTEIDQLLKSREDGIILFLFAVFILITFLLMINALIGIMTNRFQDTQTNNEMVWRLQKLSVIIFIEGWYSQVTSKLPAQFPRIGVDPEELIGEHTGKHTGESYSQKRFVMSYRKVRSTTADNPGNAEHILRQQVKKSDQLNSKMDRLLDLQESKSYDGTRALHIYHYRH